MYDTLEVSQDGRGVARLRLNRPDKHNALSARMLTELRDAAQRLGRDDDVRVVVLAASGKSFCAGGDLDWMRAQIGADAATRAAAARALAETLSALDRLPKPLIGAVHGNTFGGGVGLASICDVAIGAESLKMGLTEVRLGLIPATIGPYVIARMGAARARRVYFSGRVFGAAEAVDLGLLARAVPAADLDGAIEAEIAPYLAAAPGAVAAAKAMVADLGPVIDAAVIDRSVAALVAAWEGSEAPEGIAAFFDKRPPAWDRSE
ncbi:MAG: crotonase/enoyl-CoA hydratase family protein [Marinibacterium sp.]